MLVSYMSSSKQINLLKQKNTYSAFFVIKIQFNISVTGSQNQRVFPGNRTKVYALHCVLNATLELVQVT